MVVAWTDANLFNKISRLRRPPPVDVGWTGLERVAGLVIAMALKRQVIRHRSRIDPFYWLRVRIGERGRG